MRCQWKLAWTQAKEDKNMKKYFDDINYYQPERQIGWGSDEDEELQEEEQWIMGVCESCGNTALVRTFKGTGYVTDVCAACLNEDE